MKSTIWTLCLMICALTLIGTADAQATAITAAAHEPTIVTFDPPGSIFTYAFGINSAGVIAGAYLDASDVYHAYLRALDGAFTIFDAPGAGTEPFQGTAFYSINWEGAAAGQYIDPSGVYHGFLLARDGSFTSFEVPGAGTGTGQGTFDWNINSQGEMAGAYVDTGDVFSGTQVWHGYVRDPAGEVTEFDVPGAGSGPGQGTQPCTIDCVDAEGATAGSYIDASNVYHGFVRAENGRITKFDVRGAGTGSGQGTMPYGINLLGQAEGAYVDASYVYHGFVRAGDGSITKFDVQGAGTGSGQGTSPANINDWGAIAGEYIDAGNVNHGFARALDGRIVTFDVPEAGTGSGQGTIPYCNNAEGAIDGWYIDGSNVQHGFLRTP